MKTMYSRQIKGMAAAMVLVLLLGPIPRAMAQQVAELPVSTSSSPANGRPEPVTAVLPDSPGTVHSALVAQAPPEQEPGSATPSDSQTGDPNSGAEKATPAAGSDSSGQVPSSPDSAEPPASSATTSQPPQRPHEPVGTAAAESVAVTGVAASRPAGAAVAPAKQRRMRSLLIKVGAVIGVGVAVGTTMALSQGSPSRPPGSH